MTSKYKQLENEFDELRHKYEIEKGPILTTIESDFEFEMEKPSNQEKDIFEEKEKKQILTTTVDVQTDEQLNYEKQTKILLATENQSIQTNKIEYNDQLIQTSFEDNDETTRRLITKDQQFQFNLAVQRAVQNATDVQKKQIGSLEQQLEDKRSKIIKLKECIKKLQNFYALSSTPPSILSNVTKSIMNTSNDDESQIVKDDKSSLNDEKTNKTIFLKRSEPISMPSSFIVQSMLAAGNAATSPKT